MKQFTHRNEGFTCLHCGAEVPAASQTCRNHCTACLHSRHVDITPGDRAAGCQGLMAPVEVTVEGGLPVGLVHKCVRCGFRGKNKLADDDNRDVLFQIMEKSAFGQ